MDLREHFSTIWRRKWPVLVISVAVGAAVYAATSAQHPVYQATAQLQVVPGQTQNSGGTQSTDTLFLADTYAKLAGTRPILSQAARQSGLGIDEKTAEKRLSVKASTDVGFVTVQATGPSASAATKLAASEVNALTTTVTQQQQAALQQQLVSVQTTISALSAKLQDLSSGSSAALAINSELQSLYQVMADRQSQAADQVNVVAPAFAASSPVSPTPKRDGALAFVTALVVVSELAVGIELLGDRFGRDAAEEIRRLTGLPVLAEVPEGSAAEVIEAFRTLRTSLVFLESSAPVRTVAVVSSEPAAGKSFSCVNLAVSVAELGVRVALVDGDMRRPVIHQRLSVARAPGLSEVLLGKELWTAVRQTDGAEQLVVLPAGQPVADPPGLIAGDLTQRVINPLLQDAMLRNELVLFDTPAEALFPDAVTIAAQCDGTILIVDLRHSRRRSLRHAVERLRRVNARPMGVVINRAAAPPPSSRYRYRSRYREPVRERAAETEVSSS